MDASLFVRQHQEILAVVQGIVDALQKPSLTPEEGNRVRSSLVSLSGKVFTHLAAEDHALYPRLLTSRNPEVSGTAKKFADEMGGIAEEFEHYIEHWFNGKVISAQIEEFRSESDRLFGALAERIAKEENILYKLAKDD